MISSKNSFILQDSKVTTNGCPSDIKLICQVIDRDKTVFIQLFPDIMMSFVYSFHQLSKIDYYRCYATCSNCMLKPVSCGNLRKIMAIIRSI